ncbi:unnamed protein product [Trichobilharzia szidati]|nr:unnamed protein product [Trichobilharzia szidati]CAH8825195.1 unnamed protein product [Trichobilharzia szidati]
MIILLVIIVTLDQLSQQTDCCLLGGLDYCPNEKSLISTESDVKSCSLQTFEDNYNGNYFLDIMRLFISILFMHLIAITSIELFVY